MDFTYPSTAGADDLRLLKPTRITHEALHFTITKFPRSTAPPYTAVSYTWGDDDPSEVIHLNDRAFPVRPNLWSCLYYLGQEAIARITGFPAWTHIWVDAICIDQSDAGERSVQVRRMDQTYRDAACVSAWLGLPTIPEDIMHFPSQPASARRLPAPIKTIEVDPFDWWDAIADIANRPYWSRYWVVQEYLLGREVFLHVGNNNRIHWERFRTILCETSLVHELDPDRYKKNRPLSHRALPLVMSRHSRLVDGQHINIPQFSLQSLYDLLVSHHRSECKDPRDRVFALLGLVQPHERRLLERFFPDYSMPEEHVRIIALAHILQYHAPPTAKLPITADARELFLGLGVQGPPPERRRLLRRAKAFDYLGDWAPGEATRHLTLMAEMDEHLLDDGIEEAEEEREGRYGRVMMGLAVGCTLLSLAAVLIMSGRLAFPKGVGHRFAGWKRRTSSG